MGHFSEYMILGFFSFSYLFIMIYSMIETEQMVLSFFDYDPQKKNSHDGIANKKVKLH